MRMCSDYSAVSHISSLPRSVAQRTAVRVAPVRSTHLVARCTARFVQFGVVSSAVEKAVLVEVDQVHEELAALRAGEALRMPEAVAVRALGEDADRARLDGLLALERTTACKHLRVPAGAYLFIIIMRARARSVFDFTPSAIDQYHSKCRAHLVFIIAARAGESESEERAESMLAFGLS